MTTKSLLTLVIILVVCVACQSVGPTAPTKTATESPSLVPTATALPTATYGPATNALPSPTPVPEKEIGRLVHGVISAENAAQVEPLHVLQGHGGQIVDLAFAPDDAQIISLGGDLSLKRWDADSGEETYSLLGQGDSLYNGAISPRGDVLALEGPNHKVQLRNVQDGKIFREMAGHAYGVMSFSFSTDGSLLATGDEGGLIKVWEAETGQLVRSFSGHPSPVGALAFSPDITMLASGGVEGSHDIRIWDLASGEEKASLAKHTDNVYDLAFSPDGTLLASASGDRTLMIWDLESGQEVLTLRGHRSRVYSVDFSPDGSLLASGDFEGNVKIWDVANGKELANLSSHTDLVEPVKFSSNGCLLASGSFDSTIVLWGLPGDIYSNESGTKALSSHGGAAPLIAFYSERDGNAEIYTMNPDGSGQRRLTFNPFEDSAPVWSPDGSRIAFISDRDDPQAGKCFPDCLYQVYVIDPDGSDEHRLIETEFTTHHLDWHPDGEKSSFDTEVNLQGDIYVVNIDGSDLQLLIEDGFWADWSPDGTQIAFSSNRDGNVEIYLADADGGNQRRLTANQRMDLFPAWSPDGTKIAFMVRQDGGQQLFVMNADGSGERQLTFEGRVNEDPDWSPDGSQIVFQSNRDGNFEIYALDVEQALRGEDARGLRRLTSTAAGEYWPAWRPAAIAAATETPVPTPTTTPPASVSWLPSPQAFDARGTFQAGLGDLDGDGDLDAVFANPLRHNSEVWLNDGSGAFIDTGQQLTPYGHGVGVADFDGDGDLDAFIACHQFVTPSRIYLNDGTGRFQDNGQDLGDKGISAAEVNLLDLDGDGHMDVHILYYDPNDMPDRVYLNDGAANFTASGLALDEDTIAWGDLDGDGDVDYYGKRWGQGYVVQLNDGSGRFTPGWQMEDAQSTLGEVALADLDGDGDLDALVANGFRDTGSFPTLVFWNDGNGQFTDSGQRLNETLGAELALGDLDGDGDPDAFVANMDLPNEVWMNDGSGHFSDTGLRLGDIPPKSYSTKASLGDLDGDGDLDVFVGSLRGRPEIWFNTGTP